MKIKILRHPPGTLYMRGDIVDIPDDEAQRLVERGYAERVAVKVRTRPTKTRKTAAKRSEQED